ncbi:MAG: NAD(P)-dependent oxidoreductase [Campylobacteraceae bacterium]|jgi:glutamate synthase (NADPH/NADH) small chain|nr:NAD(P)-dependent oxidoreductase [Campylobacteraceae bacterium]
MHKNIIDLAKTCLGCKKPSCQKGCPVNTPIAEMIKLFLAGEITKAGDMLFSNNPLSSICSIVCPHEKHCEGHCILNKKFTPVSVGEIENHISDRYIRDKTFEKPAFNGKNIAIVGSGPAGISLAIIMAQKGYGITMYDENDKIGGVLRYGIPNFRLEKSILDTFEKRLKELGVAIRPHTLIGKNIKIDELFRDGFGAIFISTGVWSPKKLNIKGESLGNVHFAIDYLKTPSAYHLGDNVIVLGAGNVAMDVARTAARSGSKNVTVVYRKGLEDMPAEKHEIECAKIDGVRFEFYKEPLELCANGLKYRLSNEVGEDGFLKADSILIAVSQNPRDLIVSNNKGIDVNERGLIVTDESGRTTQQGIFASGDVVTGARTVVEAVSFSKRVAIAIDEYFSQQNTSA